MTAVLGSLAVVAVIAALTAAALIASRSPLTGRALAHLDAFSELRAPAILTCALLSFAGSAAVALLIDWPVPIIHDELSYQLAADTFASGRLTNPTHEHWQHFETFYVFHEPTYASRFPPAQGLILALGRVLAGSQVVGLWISGAFMVGAICWALYRFVPPRWAFLTGIATACQIGIASYWTQSLWGGAVAATGGALFLGGVGSLLAERSARHGVVAALGLVVLANSRPFEGAVVAAGPLLVVLIALARRRLRPRALVPALVVLAATVFMMAAYNARVTGRWWIPPYVHYELLYMERPLLAFQSEYRSQRYRHEEMAKLHDVVDAHAHQERAKARRRWFLSGWRLEESRALFLGRVLILPFLVGVAVFVSDRRQRLPAAMLASAIVAMALLRYYRPHYLAPATVAIYAASAAGLQRLASLRSGGGRHVPWGGALVAALLASLCASTVLKSGREQRMNETTGRADFVRARAAVIADLDGKPGRDLVIVRYGPRHDPHREWVYNRADIDAADIVWARDMDAESNDALIRYFADRRAWALYTGFGSARDGLFPYERVDAEPES